MTATRPTDVDELIVFLAGQGAGLEEITAALAEAGQPLARSSVAKRVKVLGLVLNYVKDVTPLPMAMSMFPRYPVHVAELLDELAEVKGLTLAVYEREKTRIVGER